MPERIIKVWNKLPYDVRSSTTVKDFKVNLEKFKQEFIEDVGLKMMAISGESPLLFSLRLKVMVI